MKMSRYLPTLILSLSVLELVSNYITLSGGTKQFCRSKKNNRKRWRSKWMLGTSLGSAVLNLSAPIYGDSLFVVQADVQRSFESRMKEIIGRVDELSMAAIRPVSVVRQSLLQSTRLWSRRSRGNVKSENRREKAQAAGFLGYHQYQET